MPDSNMPEELKQLAQEQVKRIQDVMNRTEWFSIDESNKNKYLHSLRGLLISIESSKLSKQGLEGIIPIIDEVIEALENENENSKMFKSTPIDLTDPMLLEAPSETILLEAPEEAPILLEAPETETILLEAPEEEKVLLEAPENKVPLLTEGEKKILL